MLLSRHFSLAEFTASTIAARDKIPNTPDATQTAALRLLTVNILDPLRDSIFVALFVRSGFRSSLLNAHPDIKGSDTSQHLKGEAADITAPAFAQGEVLALAHRILVLNLPFDQLILEAWSPVTRRAKWVHVSHARLGRQRGQVLTMAYDRAGKPIYTPGLP